MGRYIDAKCRLCRREGERLFLKGARCHTAKCAIAKRATPPGKVSFRRGRLSDYGVRLREKQKAKRIYGVYEGQFRGYFAEAERMRGNTGEILLQLLERRLDNVVYALGFAESRPQARQLISHGHVTVDGHKVDISSYLVRVGQTIAPSPRTRSQEFVRARMEARKGDTVPHWLVVDDKKLEGKVTQLPGREDVHLPIQENYIVEFCSR